MTEFLNETRQYKAVKQKIKIFNSAIHLLRNQTRMNKDNISKNIWNICCEAGSCV